MKLYRLIDFIYISDRESCQSYWTAHVIFLMCILFDVMVTWLKYSFGESEGKRFWSELRFSTMNSQMGKLYIIKEYFFFIFCELMTVLWDLTSFSQWLKSNFSGMWRCAFLYKSTDVSEERNSSGFILSCATESPPTGLCSFERLKYLSSRHIKTLWLLVDITDRYMLVSSGGLYVEEALLTLQHTQFMYPQQWWGKLVTFIGTKLLPMWVFIKDLGIRMYR